MRKTKVIKFKNGATLLYKKKRGHNYTAVNIGYGSGSMDNSKNGVAHFLEHMLFKQTENRTENQINEDRDKICYINAGTGPNSMFVEFYRSNKLIDKAFEFATDILFNTKLSNKYIEQEKGVITEERRIANDKADKDIEYQHNFILTTKPRTKDISLGSFKDIENITKQDLIDYKNKFYNAQNFICSVAGKISLFKTKKLLKKYVFPKLVQSPDFIPKADIFVIDKEPSMQIYKNDQEKTSMLISFKIDDFYENVIYNFNYSVIARYLNCNENSMYNELRKKGLIYSANVGFAFSDKVGYVSIKLSTGKDKIIDVIKIISKSIKDVLNGAIDDAYIKTFQDNYFYDKDETVPAKYTTTSANMARNYAIHKKYIRVEPKLEDRAVKKLDKNKVLECAKSIFVNKKPYVTFMGNLNDEDVPNFDKITKILKF